jgi:hypothetical protein
MPTPTIDTTQSKFTTPTWEVKINGSSDATAILATVELGYGSEVSNAIFVIQRDPDSLDFPVYNDNVEIKINGRSVLLGKIKGITSRISQAGLTKTFTVISNITQFRESVVPIDKDIWNVDRDKDGEISPKVNADALLQTLLGFIPSGTPVQFPGSVYLTDQTLLSATETIVGKLGNFKVYFNQSTNLLELYIFGQGGDTTRKFVKGANVIELDITENREDVVDQLTLVGPPRAIRVQQEIGLPQFLNEEVDASTGLLRKFFTINAENVRDVQVEGTHRDRPTYDENGDIQVLPEDMGIIGFGGHPPVWPQTFFTSEEIAQTGDDVGFKKALRTLTDSFPVQAPVSCSIVYENKNTAKVFIAEVPKVYARRTIVGDVLKKKIGVVGAAPDELIHVEVLTNIYWTPGSVRVKYTYDGARPTIVEGSGTVKRTITDTQYQISINQIPSEAFNNESAVLALMQQRADAEFAKLNRPNISGSIIVIGDETIDLKSTVIVNDQKLDVVRVVHNLTNGFTTQVALTNEPFVATIVATVPTEERRRQTERSTALRTTVFFQEAEIDKNVTALRQQEFQKRINAAGTSFAAYQD